MINAKIFEQIHSQSLQVRENSNRFAHLEGPLNKDRLWISEEFSHLFYLPIYSKLSRQEKLDYNHLFAITTVEQIHFFEKCIPPQVHRKKAEGTEKYLRVALEDFDEEEAEHAKMFEGWLEAARFQFEDRSEIFKVGAFSRWVLQSIFHFPNTLVFWTWALFYVEERTTIIGRRMLRRKEEYDPRSLETQVLHMKDELRHLMLTEELVYVFWDVAPMTLKKINLWLLEKTIKLMFFKPYSAFETWRRLKAIHPHLEFHDQEVVKGLKKLENDRNYLQQLLSPEACPKFWRILKTKPEMQSLHRKWSQSLGNI